MNICNQTKIRVLNVNMGQKFYVTQAEEILKNSKKRPRSWKSVFITKSFLVWLIQQVMSVICSFMLSKFEQA